MLLTYSTTKAKRALCDVAQFVAQHFDHCNDAIVLDKSIDHAKPHSIWFFVCLFVFSTISKDNEINICLDN